MIKKDEFYKRTVRSCNDDTLAEKLFAATDRQCKGRDAICKELGDTEKFRNLAMDVRNDAICDLDKNLDIFTKNIAKQGVTVHWAEDAEEARKIISKIATDNNVKKIVKSKSMITEEIELNHALEDKDIEVTETDLGEFIIQLADHKPAHIVLPAIHLSTDDVTEIFKDHILYTGPSDPKALTRAARQHLRSKFKEAQMGISGVNLAVAEQGLWSICTNEGNGRYITNKPDIYVGVMGIERIVKDLNAAGVIFKMLGRFATGQRITQYVNFSHGPCENDGPTQVHLVLLDNGRSDILASKYWPVLRCIRCGACLNACPVFRNIAGQSFLGCYSGPMGTVLLPLLLGMQRAKNIPKACTLCGLCSEVCPVKIPLADMILELRSDSSEQKLGTFIEKFAMTMMAWVMSKPKLYKLGQKAARIALKPMSKDGWIGWLPSIPGKWTKVKDLPVPAKKTFLSQNKTK